MTDRVLRLRSNRGKSCREHCLALPSLSVVIAVHRRWQMETCSVFVLVGVSQGRHDVELKLRKE